MNFGDSICPRIPLTSNRTRFWDKAYIRLPINLIKRMRRQEEEEEERERMDGRDEKRRITHFIQTWMPMNTFWFWLNMLHALPFRSDHMCMYMWCSHMVPGFCVWYRISKANDGRKILLLHIQCIIIHMCVFNTSPLYLYFFTFVRMSYINIIYHVCVCVCVQVNPSECFKYMQSRPIRGIFTWIHYITCRTINEIKYNRMLLCMWAKRYELCENFEFQILNYFKWKRQ